MISVEPEFSGCGGCGLRLGERREVLPVAPHAVQQDGQFAGHRDDGSLFAALAAGRGQLQAPAAQGRVGAEAAQDILRRLHQQAAQVRVAGLGDAPLRVGFARLALAGTQAQEGACGAVAGRIGPIKRENIGGGYDRSYSGCGAARRSQNTSGRDFLSADPGRRSAG